MCTDCGKNFIRIGFYQIHATWRKKDGLWTGQELKWDFAADFCLDFKNFFSSYLSFSSLAQIFSVKSV